MQKVLKTLLPRAEGPVQLLQGWPDQLLQGWQGHMFQGWHHEMDEQAERCHAKNWTKGISRLNDAMLKIGPWLF